MLLDIIRVEATRGAAISLFTKTLSFSNCDARKFPDIKRLVDFYQTDLFMLNRSI